MAHEVDIAFTKEWIRKFILSKKLGADVNIPDDVYQRLVNLWMCDDAAKYEYKMLRQRVEEEMRDEQRGQ